MNTRSQRTAREVYEQVAGIEGSVRKDYARVAYKLPVLLRVAGAVQALEFLARRASPGAKKLLEHMGGDKRLEEARTAPLGRYLRLSEELALRADWLKRFAQSVLKYEPTEEDEESQS